jgi:CRP-like cAMP-binding protein
MAATLQLIRTVSSEDPMRPKGRDDHLKIHEKSLRNKKTDELAKIFFRGIKHYAGLKEFSKAEAFREKLIAIAPMAVDEIVKSAEIIEKEKIAAMDLEKIKPWAELFNSFTTGEAASFYAALKFVSVKKHQRIYKQGDCDNRLFFIESGCLKLSYYNHQLKKNVVFAHLRQGDTCGVEAFFTFSPHTSSLTAVDDSRIGFLEKNVYQKLKADYPAIESKMIAYCEKKQKQLVVQNPQDPIRRAHQRHPVCLKGILRRIDDRGDIQHSMAVVVSDISAGGACLKVRHMGIGDAANYYQSHVQLVVSYQKHFIAYDLVKEATVVSIRLLPFDDASIHLQFKTPLDNDKLLEIARCTNIPTFL